MTFQGRSCPTFPYISMSFVYANSFQSKDFRNPCPVMKHFLVRMASSRYYSIQKTEILIPTLKIHKIFHIFAGTKRVPIPIIIPNGIKHKERQIAKPSSLPATHPYPGSHTCTYTLCTLSHSLFWLTLNSDTNSKQQCHQNTKNYEPITLILLLLYFYYIYSHFMLF